MVAPNINEFERAQVALVQSDDHSPPGELSAVSRQAGWAAWMAQFSLHTSSLLAIYVVGSDTPV